MTNLSQTLKDKGFTLLDEDGKNLKVQCDNCNSILNRVKYSLLKKKLKYCGKCVHANFDKYQEEIGRKYKKLTVVRFVKMSKHNKPIFEFKCECGNFTEAILNNVIFGKTSSCGCTKSNYMSKSKRLPLEHLAVTRVMDSMTCKKRNLEVELSREDVEDLIFKPCTYCGELNSNEYKARYGESIKYNGVDRIDSTKGYLKDNVVTCCKVCNYAKSNKSLDEFKKWVSNIHYWTNRIDKSEDYRIEVDWKMEDLFD